jgi:TatA/E family protein of Tat protein translocase
MGSLGMPEILMIMVIALIIFGPRKLPELGKTLGQSLAQFRRASEDFKRQWEDEVELERRRLDTPPPVERPAGAEPDSTHVEEYGTSELEQPAAAPAAEQEPVTVPRGENVITETKRDWM